jgi:hypothetical protein
LNTTKLIYKVELDGSITEFSRTSSPQGLAVGPDELLYGAVSMGRVKKIVRFDNSGNENLLTTLPESPWDLDFDDNGTLWVIAYNTIFTLDELGNYKQYEVSGQFSCIAMYSGYLYAGGTIDSKQAVWRFPVIDEDSLDSGELYFDMSNAFSGTVPSLIDINISSTGQLVIAFAAAEGLLYVNSSDNFFFGLKNDIPAAVYSLDLTSDDRVYAVYHGDIPGIYRQILLRKLNQYVVIKNICGPPEMPG